VTARINEQAIKLLSDPDLLRCFEELARPHGRLRHRRSRRARLRKGRLLLVIRAAGNTPE
jgi:hypothetical protein